MTDKNSFTGQDHIPSGEKPVDTIKRLANDLATAIDEHCKDGPLKEKAILDAQSASVFAVKSFFSKDGRM